MRLFLIKDAANDVLTAAVLFPYLDVLFDSILDYIIIIIIVVVTVVTIAISYGMISSLNLLCRILWEDCTAVARDSLCIVSNGAKRDKATNTAPTSRSVHQSSSH